MELIDRDAVMDKIHDFFCNGCPVNNIAVCNCCEERDAIDAIKAIPTVDAKPAVHSKLKHFRAYHQCDNCGQHFQTRMGQGYPRKWKGCPYCLAVWDAI